MFHDGELGGAPELPMEFQLESPENRRAGKSAVVVVSSSQSSVHSHASVISAEHDKTSSASSHSSLPVKRMKAASASSQFYTTIVVKVCVSCREWLGTVPADRRAAYIFRNVESGLRDRFAFPLPPTVKIRELMENSFFQGNDAEDEYQKFCKDEDEPLTQAMIELGTRLYVRRLPPFFF
jgi:hypothetical protein